MVDFSIQTVTDLFVVPARRCFEKAAGHIASKHPRVERGEIYYDLKALVFDTTSTMIVTTVALAYFKTIALITAVALIIFFYLVRRIIETIPLPPLKKDHRPILGGIANLTRKLVSRNENTAPPKTTREKITATFSQGNDIAIGTVVLFKFPLHPLPQVIRMIFTRSS
jgi:hypothetical protein